MGNRGLPRLAGGIAKREREAWEKPCALASCGEPAAGLIESPLQGPKPICSGHIPEALCRGYNVRMPNGEFLRPATPESH